MTKYAITHQLSLDESRVLGAYLSLTLVRNTGGAFGILQNSAALLGIVSVIAVVGIIAAIVRLNSPIPWILGLALSLPLGGSLGNMADRLRLGYVVDFIDVHYGPHEFPVFNVADSAICTGVTLLSIYVWTKREPQPNSSAPTES